MDYIKYLQQKTKLFMFLINSTQFLHIFPPAAVTSDLPLLCCISLVLRLHGFLWLLFSLSYFRSIQLLADQTLKQNSSNFSFTEDRWAFRTKGWSATHLMVGTAKGSKLSNSLRSMGTETRPVRVRKRSDQLHFTVRTDVGLRFAHLFWGEHWRGSSVNGWHLYWRSRRAEGSSTAAWSPSQSVGPF